MIVDNCADGKLARKKVRAAHNVQKQEGLRNLATASNVAGILAELASLPLALGVGEKIAELLRDPKQCALLVKRGDELLAGLIGMQGDDTVLVRIAPECLTKAAPILRQAGLRRRGKWDQFIEYRGACDAGALKEALAGVAHEIVALHPSVGEVNVGKAEPALAGSEGAPAQSSSAQPPSAAPSSEPRASSVSSSHNKTEGTAPPHVSGPAPVQRPGVPGSAWVRPVHPDGRAERVHPTPPVGAFAADRNGPPPQQHSQARAPLASAPPPGICA